MRKSALLAFFTCLFLLLNSFFPQIVSAGDTGALVRLDRTALSSATGGLVCLTTPPTNNGTENSVQLVFPQGFSVNSTPSHWTISTTNLPSGSIAWPGISTATAVSGQIVTFPTNDLAANTQYCFNFSSTNTLTTPATTGTYTGTIRTRNASNGAIDQSNDYGIAIVTSDQVSVTATVPANPTDYHAGLDLVSPSNDNYMTEGTVMTFRLAYDTILSQNSNITVEAQWNLGTLQGGSTPTENILEYIVGSASYGYNGAPPVIDIANRKIDWTINNFPGGTRDQAVTFKMLVNPSSTTTKPVTFSVDGRVLGPGTQTADSTIRSTYQKSTYITPTPTPTCTPLTCPTPTPAPTGIPTPTTPPTPKPIIKKIDIRAVNSHNATIYVATARPASIRIDIGRDFRTLRSLGFSKNPATQHLIDLHNLEANSQYFFRVIATDHEANTTSDLYLLSTALESEPQITIEPESLIISSSDVILADGKTSTKSAVILPASTAYSFKFSVKDYSKIKSIKAVARNNNVLGINTVYAEPLNSDSIPVPEIGMGQYVGKLVAPNPGNYKLVLQIQDFNGNISEQVVATIFVVAPLQILDLLTKQGVENAKITFYIYNQRLKIYELITSGFTPIKNPNFSEPDGNVLTVLPEGKYRMKIEVLGFKPKTVDFEINWSQKKFYPQVTITSLPFDILTMAKYYVSTLSDVITNLQNSLSSMRISFRFFNLTALFMISFLAFLLTVATSRRFSVPILQLPFYAFYHVEILFRKPKHTFLIHGSITTTGSDEAISGAKVYISRANGTVISHTTTNLYGEFFTKIHEACNIRVTVSKKDFQSTTTTIPKSKLNKRFSIQIMQTGKPAEFSIDNLKWYIEFLLSSLVEAFLIITLAVELLFILEFGFIKVAPFIVIAIINIILWAVNMKEPKR